MAKRDHATDDYFQVTGYQPSLFNEPAQDGAPWVGPLVPDPPAAPLYSPDAGHICDEEEEQAWSERVAAELALLAEDCPDMDPEALRALAERRVAIRGGWER